MLSARDRPLGSALRVVLVGTGTGVGKTHVACALLGCWSTRIGVVGLKPVETGIDVRATDAARPGEMSDQERLAEATGAFHVKQSSGWPRAPAGVTPSRSTDSLRASGGRSGLTGLTGRQRATDRPWNDARGGEGRTFAAELFHVKRGPARVDHRAQRSANTRLLQPHESLFAFPEPVSPHIAAREARVRIDLGLIERWVQSHEAPITVIETAGGWFSPLGHGSTNFELTQALQPDAVLLVASDRLGVLHDLTTTLALAAARGGPLVGVVLSHPEKVDASTGRNAAELEALGIASPIAVFPRADLEDPTTRNAARLVTDWVEGRGKAGATDAEQEALRPSPILQSGAPQSGPARSRPRSK